MTWRILPAERRFQVRLATAGTMVKGELVRALRILLVDDDADLRAAVAEFLARTGHLVQVAGNGCEGLAKFQAGTYDLVLTDRDMPVMDGERLAAAVKWLSPQTPVIMITGAPGLLSSETRARIVDFIVTKPFSPPDLCLAIREVVGGS